MNRVLKLQCQFGTVISLIFFLTGFSNSWFAKIFGSGPDVCQAWLPTSDLISLYDALICGTPLPAGRAKLLFVDSGLIHLMVVSGSHLVFLEMLLGFLPQRALHIVLLLYCYLTGFQAPVVRAFLRRIASPALKRVSGMTTLQIEAATVLIALAVYPQWLTSRSFLMSWMCGLALAAPRFFSRAPNLDLALKAYLFLLPFCWASPLTVAWNTLLSPIVGMILFPACILSIVLPPLTYISDGMWKCLMLLLEMGPKGEPLGLHIPATQLLWIPFVVHGSLLIWEVKWRRASAFLPSPTS